MPPWVQGAAAIKLDPEFAELMDATWSAKDSISGGPGYETAPGLKDGAFYGGTAVVPAKPVRVCVGGGGRAGGRVRSLDGRWAGASGQPPPTVLMGPKPRMPAAEGGCQGGPQGGQEGRRHQPQLLLEEVDGSVRRLKEPATVKRQPAARHPDGQLAPSATPLNSPSALAPIFPLLRPSHEKISIYSWPLYSLSIAAVKDTVELQNNGSERLVGRTTRGSRVVQSGLAAIGHRPGHAHCKTLLRSCDCIVSYTVCQFHAIERENEQS